MPVDEGDVCDGSVVSERGSPMIDPQLTAVALKQWAGLPLPLRRFTEWHGQSSPIAAVEVATTRLLDRYRERSVRNGIEPSGMIRVSQLCSICNSTVRGRKFTSSGETVYSTASPRSTGIGAFGRLELTAEQRVIHLPESVRDRALARVVVAHELGHILIHQRGNCLDQMTVGLESTPEEEAIAEYAARLMLTPKEMVGPVQGYTLAQSCVYLAGSLSVTIHASALRFGDVEIQTKLRSPVRAVILWRLSARSPSVAATASRLTPQWFIAPSAFIPVGRCHARGGSVIAQAADYECGEKPAALQCVEEVRIGSLKGTFLVDAFAWGSLRAGRRLVLSFFCEPHT